MLETSSNTWRPTITKSYVNNVMPSLAKWSPPALIPKPHSTLAMCAIATTTIRVTLNSICSNTSVNRVAFLPLWWPRLEPIPTWPMFCNRPWPTGSTLGTSQSSINTSINANIAIGALNIQVRFSYLPTWAGMDYLLRGKFILSAQWWVCSLNGDHWNFVILRLAQSQKVFDVGFNVQKNVPNTVLSIFS